MSPAPRWTLLIGLWTLAAACGEDADRREAPAVTDADVESDAAEPDAVAPPDADLPCPFVDDGVCDEPASCALGTDEADCARACELDEPPGALYGACAWRRRGESVDEPVDDAALDRASHGEGGAYGRVYGSLLARGPRRGTRVRRHYALYVPDTYDPARPAPLLIYGSGFSVPLFGKFPYTDLERAAEVNGFVLVFAEQLMREMGELGPAQGWHVYNQAFEGDWAENPDVDFYRELVGEIATGYNLDLGRVYASGHSRGAGAAIIAAFLAPEVITGFCAQAGFVGVNDFQAFIRAYAGPTMPAVVVHGHQDDDVHPGEGALTARVLTEVGWNDADRLRYYALDGVGHQWQPQITQAWWEFLAAHAREVTP